MKLNIRKYEEKDLPAIIEISLLAWAPIFESFEAILGKTIFRLIYPDWKAGQRSSVESACIDTKKNTTLVAEVDGITAGFLVYDLNPKDATGEVQLLAVHPQYQNQGIGTELNLYALRKMKEAGIKLAVVGTGGDPAHAPARRSYEKAGYSALPLVRYYKDL